MSRFKLLVTANAFRVNAPISEGPVHAAGGEVLYPPRMGPLPAAELIPHLREADAVIASTDPYTAEVLDACPRLRVIVRWGTGVDSVDVAACTERGVVACNTPGFTVQAVADHVFAVMLGMARHIPEQVALVRGGGWSDVRGVELWGKSLGIIGFGAIGKAVARRARGFDLRVLAYDPALSPEQIRAEGAQPVGLENLFAASDFITLHAALTPESRGMVHEALLRRMKPTAYFVNAARGPLLDETALVRALREGWLAGAAVDTFTEEPLPADHPLRQLPNCLPTSHTAFNTEEAAAATNRAVVEEALTVLRGGRPRFALNPEVFDRLHFRRREPLI